MGSTLAQDTLRQLALIRHLYTIGDNQAQQPEPMSALSILAYHDAVELFLELGAREHGINANNTPFMRYWELYRAHSTPIHLAGERSMRQLDDTRGVFKHRGVAPSKKDIDGFQVKVASFFEENTTVVFGINFGSISMAFLVESEYARTYLERASICAERADFDEALGEIAIAFVELLNSFTQKTEQVFDQRMFSLDDTLHLRQGLPRLSQPTPVLFSPTTSLDPEAIDSVRFDVEALQSAVSLLAFGIDYVTFMKFRAIVPDVFESDEGWEASRNERQHPASMAGYQFCYDFVISTALHLQTLNLAPVS